ncbi:MAG: hypothetical protein U0892_17180 [Pirellulales bacterium]
MTRVGRSRFVLNNGDMTFKDVSEQCGIDCIRGDGCEPVRLRPRRLARLCVVNYADYFPGSICEDASWRRDFCGPESLNGTSDRLFRNVTGDLRRQAKEAGDATTASTNVAFSDVTVSSGIAKKLGKDWVCSAVISTVTDIPASLWPTTAKRMRCGCNIQEVPVQQRMLLRGVALNRSGEAEANMGSLPTTSIATAQRFPLRQQRIAYAVWARSPGQFMDRTVESGFSVSSLPFTGFDSKSVDFDHDGRDLDLAISNGGAAADPHPTRKM